MRVPAAEENNLPLKRSHDSTYLQSVFVGLSYDHVPSTSGLEGLDDLHWYISVSEGFAIQHSEKGEVKDVDLREGKGGAARVINLVVERLREFATSQNYKIQLVAVAEAGLPAAFLQQEPLFLPTLWQKLDVIPFLIPLSNFPPSSQSPTTSPTLSFFPPPLQRGPRRKHIDLSFLPPQTHKAEGEDRAQKAVREAVKALSPTVKSATTVDTGPEDGEVEVDRAGEIQLASLSDYESTTSAELWATFLALAKHMKANRVQVSFFSATPQGGGVALMRHALIRLWRLVGVDVKWFVPEGHPAIFTVTKKKFHNVLQGVNKPGVRLHDTEKTMFEKWTEANLETFWSEGAIDSRIIVIDDPQLSALIPLIRTRHPGAKVVFRSHIQIDSKLVDDPKKDNVHRDVWEYLWGFIKESDLFIAHPVKAFVPKITLESNVPVTYMPPSTDPLDGLNKPIGAADVAYYRQYFGRQSTQQCGMTVNWSRPYIMQVARFDPSKGIPVLLEAYLTFRKRLGEMEEKPRREEVPQLIIAGHGSVDDPDGQPIFEEISTILHSDEYAFLKDDVSVVRVPPCDRTLGAILQGAWCATQLSTKEGFEVKVTEAVHKRVPIIISSAGGLPLQVKDGVNGWIVPSGQSQPVADKLFDLFTSDFCPLSTISTFEKEGKSPNSVADEIVSNFEAKPPRINPSPEDGSSAEKEVGTSEDFWTVGNAVKWMTIWSRLGSKEIDTDDEGLLEGILGKKGEGVWDGIEGRSVWETVTGKKEDGLVI